MTTTGNKTLLNWAKEKTALIHEFRTLLRVPYDRNLYAVVQTVQDKMFVRRQQVVIVIDLLRDFAKTLDSLKQPIFAVEEALDIIKEGKRRLDFFKIDYLLAAKRNRAEFEELEKIVIEENIQKEDKEKVPHGIFEEIGFNIDKYFHSHYYINKK